MTPGQRAYEADVQARPRYHDGTPRRKWQELSEPVQWSWEKSPHPLPCVPENAGSN